MSSVPEASGSTPEVPGKPGFEPSADGAAQLAQGGRPTYRNRDMCQMAKVSKPRHGPNGQGIETETWAKWPRYRNRDMGQLAKVSNPVPWPIGPCLGFERLGERPFNVTRPFNQNCKVHAPKLHANYTHITRTIFANVIGISNYTHHCCILHAPFLQITRGLHANYTHITP